METTIKHSEEERGKALENARSLFEEHKMLKEQVNALRALSIAVTEKLTRGESPIVEAALVKDLGTGVEQLIPAAIADDLFARSDSDAVPLELLQTLNYVTLVAPCYSLRGGTRDILRGMIARGLGLR